ncbi:MAG: cytochrome C, partial [Candidatus Hydrogenedentota bacterium]
NGNVSYHGTDGNWSSIGEPEPEPGWSRTGYADSAWTASKVIGPVGADAVTWTSAVTMAAVEDAEEYTFDPTPVAIPVDNLNLLPGFKAQKVYEVPRDSQGSWVSMTNAPDGGFFVSDQGGAGIYHVMPSDIRDPESRTKVTPIPARISGAQGMLWAFNSLYVHVNDGGKSGLYRVTDSDGNGDLDKVDRLMRIKGSGEHGPHAIIFSEDGENLIINAGNHTDLPEISGSRLPSNWDEDHLLPRQWDANGHAKGRMAPGGWICKVSPDGQNWEVISSGYRNEYDIDMNPEGEIFAFDADMEWDQGSPWYRPTRICHAVSGSEFGWRGGTGKWPTYYPDSLPPVVDIGPGSPTGIVFGTESKFPAKYQQALFALDWTFGTIYAVHMTPSGASYVGEKEEFVSGSPLAVTDTTFGADGAFYFCVGGRGTQSALYRVYYDGPESTERTPRSESQDTIDARKLRRSLEVFHGKMDSKAVDTAWAYLSHEDRFIRYAARLAIESQPVSEWRRRALREKNPQAAMLALIALARQGDEGVQDDILDSLDRFDILSLDESVALGMMRAYALTFSRLGRPDQFEIDQVVAKLDPLLPSSNDTLNTELVRVLVYLDAPGIVDKGMELLNNAPPTVMPDWVELIKRNNSYGGTIQAVIDNPPPGVGINLALMLRNVRYGWSMEQREDYFNFINEASKYPGGSSYPGFLTNIRDEALQNCSDAEKVALAPITGQSLESLPQFDISDPIGPYRELNLADAKSTVRDRHLNSRDFENGRNAFFAVGCAKCHRFDGLGGAVGPDLSSVSGKFSIADLLEAIVEPNNAISDQYGSSLVETHDGDLYEGLVIDESGSKEEGEIQIYTIDPNADPILVKTADIKSIEDSPISQMPEGLLNALNDDEVRDLVAYLMSRGNKDDSMFK